MNRTKTEAEKKANEEATALAQSVGAARAEKAAQFASFVLNLVKDFGAIRAAKMLRDAASGLKG